MFTLGQSHRFYTFQFVSVFVTSSFIASNCLQTPPHRGSYNEGQTSSPEAVICFRPRAPPHSGLHHFIFLISAALSVCECDALQSQGEGKLTKMCFKMIWGGNFSAFMSCFLLSYLPLISFLMYYSRWERPQLYCNLCAMTVKPVLTFGVLLHKYLK